MKMTSKFLAVMLALCMVLSLGAVAFASGEPAAAAPAAASGEPAAAATTDDAAVKAAYYDYIHEWLIAEDAVNDNMTEEIRENEFMPGVQAALQTGDWSQFPVDMLFNGMLNTGVAMTYEEFAAQYVPAGDASGEASGDTSGEASVEDAYVEYIHEFLLAELAVNGNMTTEQVEDEFMPAVKSAVVTGDWVNSTTPAPLDILFNGMLVNGAAMTFEEFAAQYTPAATASASGEPAAAAAPAAGAAADPAAAYVEYLHQWLLAELAVNSSMTIEQVENEFMPGIQAAMQTGDWSQFPVDMLFNGMLNSGVAMTYDQFVAAG